MVRVLKPIVFATAAILAVAVASFPQQSVPRLVPVRPIEPPRSPLPPEDASSGISRFSFVAYGDTRSRVDGAALQPQHGMVIDGIVARINALAASPFPVRFVLQSGDAVTNGTEAAQWNVSFTPLIERLTGGLGLPYFFAIGNHDVPDTPSTTGRSLGLHNTLAAISKLIPPEGSPRRLNGYPTYAFGFGNLFAMAIDSNIASDATQLAWVVDQLEHLDRARYRHVVVFFHHPPFSSGPHGGIPPGTPAGSARDNAEPETIALRTLYGPLFRRYRIRMTITGHDHLYDHFVERYTDNGDRLRIDHIVAGGGGAPIYTYRGEPQVAAYLAAGSAQNVRLEHVVRPGGTVAENPHHFVIIQVDGDRLSLQVVGTGPAAFQPYGGRSQISLDGPPE